MSILVKNGYVFTNDTENTVIQNGAIYLENGIIVELGSSNVLENKYQKSTKIIDAKGRLVMPGLICSHMHFYSAFATGMPLKPFDKGFVNVLKHLWWKLDQALDEEAVYYSALLGYIQAVKSGTTSVIDHHASPSYVIGSLDLIEKAARQLGVRSNLCYEITNRNSDEEALLGLEENERFIRKCSENSDDLISAMLGLHASFTVSDDVLDKSAEIIEKYNCGVHIHVAEDKADMNHARENFDSTVLERLEKHRLLKSKTLLGHCIHIDDIDYSIAKKYDCNISHQPRSNMNNAVGTINLFKLVETGIDVGLGTDGMSSDMKAEVMVGNLIHKHEKRDNTIGTVEIYNALFDTNPKIFEKITGVKTGRLQIGWKADLIISNYYPKSPVNPDNTIGHVLFGMINESVATTIIDGKICMEEGVIDGIDEEEISKKCQKIAPKIWDRVNSLPDYP